LPRVKVQARSDQGGKSGFGATGGMITLDQSRDL